jgi:tRNA (adenine37-N6)-methyltransferase
MTNFYSIGVIRTPYSGAAETPYQPLSYVEEGAFYIELDPRFEAGLLELDSFNYITVLYHVHRLERPVSMEVQPS